MSGAPAAVSRDLQQYTEFAGSDGGLIMRTCAAISDMRRVVSNVVSAAANGAFSNKNSSGNIIQSSAMALSPTQPVGLFEDDARELTYLSPVFDLIGSAFTRYKIRKLIFHYEPQSPATTSERLVFAFAADPAHPVLASQPLFPVDLLAMADSIAFMPWKEWSMDVTDRIDADKLFYTYSHPPGTTLTEAQFIVDRFSDFGVMACVSSDSAPTPVDGGVLYMEAEFEFIEFCPITIASPAALAMLAVKIKHHSKRHKGEKPAAQLERLRSEKQEIAMTIKDIERKLMLED